MGFALWLGSDTACAQGTHEYRPMGVAYVARSAQFTARDFRPGVSREPDAHFAGYFASLNALNERLRKRRSQKFEKKVRKTQVLLRSII